MPNSDSSSEILPKPKSLVGNKVDDPSRRVVLDSDARRFAETMKINYFETSAKENLNVEAVRGHVLKILKIF